MVAASMISCGNDVIFDEDAQLTTDIALIEEFLADNALEADTLLPSEIRIIINDPGEGPKASFGSSVSTRYTGYLLDGTEFDTTEDGGGPFSFIVDAGVVVQGWNIAFKELSKGANATIFLPSSLGYGNQQFADIPANSVLIFNVQVLDIR